MQADPHDDPKPQPPAEPGPDDCCHSGCTWCVLDLYYEDLERYRTALAAWEARHPNVHFGVRNKGGQSSSEMSTWVPDPEVDIVSARTEGKPRRR